MLYKSLKNFNYKVSFKEAVLTGQSPEKGLYFPENIPVLNKKIIKNISNYDEHHLMMEVIQPFIGNEIPHKELLNIIYNSVNFKINIHNIYDNIYSLELFLGPTMAFKGIGVKFMSGCIKYFCKELNKNIIILTATSGDTGAAVANAFNKIDGVKVVILYPSSKISILQEKQITTLGNNILALEIKGDFDDCQMLVKNALTGKGVHVVTVNEYLAKRDSEWMAPIMEFHGLTVDCIDLYKKNSYLRRKAYEADVTYGTNIEFVFDYLRDNMVFSCKNLIQRELNYAIIDEIDSVLIDEAGTPLIISGVGGQVNSNFDLLKDKVKKLFKKQLYFLNKIFNSSREQIISGNEKEGGLKLFKVYRGLPKYKPLIKFLGEKK